MQEQKEIFRNIKVLIAPLKGEIEGKRSMVEKKKSVIRTNNLYLEQFDRQISRVVMGSIFAIEGLQESIKEEFYKKQKSFLTKIEIFLAEMEQMMAWRDLKYQELVELNTLSDGASEVVALLEVLVEIEKVILECQGDLTNQKNFIENLVFNQK